MAFGLNLDSVNGSKNEFNKVVGDSLQGFHRITFDPFIMVNTRIDNLIIILSNILMVRFLFKVETTRMEIHQELQKHTSTSSKFEQSRAH